ncbi:MAG: hypothetical protein ABW006_14785 [Hyphomicrobium sp.]
MPRYYFDIHDSGEITEDDEGLELRDLGIVQNEAARSLADMARDAVRSGGSNLVYSMAIKVRDDTGLVMQVKFSFQVDHN